MADDYKGLRFWQVFLLLAWFWLLIILLETLGGAVGGRAHPLENNLLLQGGFFTFAAFMTILTGVVFFKSPFRPSFAIKTVHPGLVPALVMAVMGVLIIGSELDNLIRFTFPSPNDLVPTQTGQPTFWVFILFIVLVPIAMELLFRGYMLKGLLTHYPEELAVIVSGLFMVSPMFIFTPATAMFGLLSAWIYSRTKSIVPSLFLAVAFYGLPTLLDNTKIVIPGFNTNPAHPQLQPLWFDGIGILLLILGVGWMIALYGSQYKSRPTSDQ